MQNLREGSEQVATLLLEYAKANAQAEAQTLANNARIQRSFEFGDFALANASLNEYRPALQGGFAFALRGHASVASINAPAEWEQIGGPLIDALGANRRFSWGNLAYAVGESDVGRSGLIVVAIPLPANFDATMLRIAESQRNYQELATAGKAVRRAYILLLLLITALVLFAATWLSLFISKLVTPPVAPLAEAMQELSLGHFSY